MFYGGSYRPRASACPGPPYVRSGLYLVVDCPVVCDTSLRLVNSVFCLFLSPCVLQGVGNLCMLDSYVASEHLRSHTHLTLPLKGAYRAAIPALFACDLPRALAVLLTRSPPLACVCVVPCARLCLPLLDVPFRKGWLRTQARSGRCRWPPPAAVPPASGKSLCAPLLSAAAAHGSCLPRRGSRWCFTFCGRALRSCPAFAGVQAEAAGKKRARF